MPYGELYAVAERLGFLDRVKAELEALSENFPEDVKYEVVYDSTKYVTASIRTIFTTLLITTVIVGVVTRSTYR